MNKTYNNWVDSQGCDSETLVEITREMTSLLYKKQIKLEDSRCFYRLCIDATILFQTLHRDADWDIEDFLTEVVTFSESVCNKIGEFPNWINSDYKWMFGKDDLCDLMKR